MLKWVLNTEFFSERMEMHVFAQLSQCQLIIGPVGRARAMFLMGYFSTTSCDITRPDSPADNRIFTWNHESWHHLESCII